MDRVHATPWAFPATFGAHVAEEAAGGFTEWAQREASPHYTQRGCVRNNALGLVMTFAATALATRWGGARRGRGSHVYFVRAPRRDDGHEPTVGQLAAPGRPLQRRAAIRCRPGLP
jgi:hypothetical protein